MKKLTHLQTLFPNYLGTPLVLNMVMSGSCHLRFQFDSLILEAQCAELDKSVALAASSASAFAAADKISDIAFVVGLEQEMASFDLQAIVVFYV